MDNPILNNDELSEVEGVEGILDINRRKQIELDKIEDARVKAQKDFDFYARDAGGEPLDLGRVEEYKSKVEPWRFEQSLYGLQEDHFNASTPEQVNANRRFTPILDSYLLDNPEAFQNLDKQTNREEHIARTLREDSYHYPMFSGEKRGEFTDLKTSEYERLAVANYFSETSDVGFDSVMKNMDLLASSYAQANGLETPDVPSVFNHIKGNLSQRKTERENDKANWQNGISSVLNGKSLNEALAGSVDDKNGRVTSASRSAFMNEYGGELSKATELYERFSQEAGRTESAQSKLKFDIMPMKMMGGVVSAFTDVPKHQKDAVEQLAIMPREQRQRTLALMYMMAEDNAGELDAGFFGKTGESFARGLDAYIANVGDALELNPEGMVRDADYNRSKRELRQDLGSIKQTVSEIKSDFKFVQGVYDSAGSLTYQLAAALPKGAGVALNTLSMSTDNDIKLRRLYPDMDHSKRWQIALGAGTVQSAIERASFRGAFKSFPSVSRYMSGKGIAGKLGMVGLRGAGILAIENLEESAQSATLPIMQSIWGAFADDIPDVSAEDWEESMFLYDERTFFATLPLAVLGAGGKSALDMIGAKASSDMLSDIDRVMVHGFNRDQAGAIANEPDSLKKYFMFKEGSDAKTVEERKSLSDEAVAGGALNRIADKEEAEAWQAYEDNVNEKGSEDEKTALEVEKLARDYSKRYDAQITQEGDQYKVTYPENKPSQNFDTKEEADAAMVAHKVEVNEGYLDALSSASANVQAMLEHKKTLEKKHKGAKVKLGKSIVGLKEFAEKSDKNMAQALERIEHELIKTGEVRPATRADLDKWHTRGEVRLRKKARGYVARLAEGANIADLVEEGSEGFLRDIIKAGLIDSKWVKEQIINYQNETGNKLTSSDNVDGMSDQQMIEAFSDLAVGNFYNAHQQDQTGSLGSIINALRIFFAKVATVAEDLLKLQTEGKIDADFQTLLDNSVGLDMDEQIDRQADEVQKEMLGGETLSIAPEMSEEEKQVGEGADTEAGTPAPDSPAETILPDDSKPQIDWTDPSYSVSPKYLPEVFPLMTEEIARKVLSETDTTSAIHIDRMRVGEFEGVPLQGGMFFPSIVENLKERVAWAFNSVGVARTVVDRAALHGGYVKLVLMTEGNVVGNKTFATIWLNRMDKILDTEEKKADFMKEFHKVRLAAIKTIVNKKRRDERIKAEKATQKGEKPADPVDEMSLATYHRDGESVTSYDQVRKFMLDMGQSDRGSHYLTRGTQGKATKVRAKGETIYGKLLGAKLSEKQGYPNASEIVDAIEEPAFKGMKKGDVVGLIKLDAIEKGSAIQTAKEVGVTEHLSYGYVVKGEPVAKMKDIHNIEEMYPSIAGQMMSQQNKAYDAKEHITFSIAPTLDALEPTNQEEQQAFDKASKFQDRNPYLAVASNRLRNKVISRTEFRAIVDEVDPFIVKGVEDIPSLENISKFLIKSKADKLGKEVETGKTVELRIDIPTYNASIKEDFNSPVYAVTLHEKSNSKDKAGSVLSYQPAAHVKNPEFFARPTAKAADKKVGALSIAEGGGKFPLATVRGELVTTDPTSLPPKEELQGWAEVGYNPTRSSEFRDVKNGQIVSGGSESVSIGSRVYVKNPTYKTEDSLGEFGGKNISFSITPAQDAAYMDAVESGDVETQQRMVDEAAKRAGLIKSKHATPYSFDKFSREQISTSDPDTAIMGFHVSNESDVNSSYVSGSNDRGKRGATKVLDLFIDIRNPISRREAEVLVNKQISAKVNEANNWSHDSVTNDDRFPIGYDTVVFDTPLTITKEKQEKFAKTGELTSKELGYKGYNIKASSDYDGAVDLFDKNEHITGYSDINDFISSHSDDHYVLRSPNQIKLADPVTYDADGNVIPLSQRFDAGRDEISMSIAPAEDIVMERITALMRDPDSKLDVYKNMATRLRKVRERIYSKRIAYGKITPESMSEADKEMDEREFIISSVAQIEAIERVLPPEVRRSLGTKKRASEYKTSKGFARYVSQRLDSVDTALEKYLRRELRASVSKLVKKSQPMSKSKASDSGQSKIGDVGHRVAEAALKAMKMTPEQAARAAQDERATLAEIKEPTIEKTQEHEDVAYIYEMFADFANADSNRLTMMQGLMKTNWDEGRKQWLDVLAKRREWKDNKVKAVVTSLKKMGKSITEKNNAGGMSSKIANAAREQLSFYNITDLLREDMKGEGSAVVGEMTDDLRRANNSFEWAQLQHKEEMKQVFSDIFGIKGTNKTARVQARLNSLAKEVDWGSRVTVVDRFNPDNRISVGNMSQLDLLKDWLAVQQLDLKDKYDTAGHDEQYRTQLDDVLDDDVKELGMWMQNKLREMTPDTEKLHRSEYGLAMATVENYFPAVFEHRGKEETSLQIDGIDVAGVSKRPSAHKMRVNHNSDPERQNAAHTFNHHIMQDAFWKSHAEVLRKWAGVLRNAEVQRAIKASKGKGFLTHLNKRLDDIETQGSAVAQIQLESDLFARSLGKGMSLGILGIKLSTIWKNFTALTNVALGVEAKELISGLRPEVFREAKDLLKTETFQRRLKMGASVATRYALEGGKRGNVLFTTTERLAEVGVQGINIADTGSNMTMAIAYVARLRKLRSEGVVDAEARAQALDHVDDLMARYAQPTDRLSKSMFENRRMPLVTFLVMFQSEARKQMAINSLAVRKLLSGKGVQSRSLAAQQLLVQVVGVNLMIHVVSSLYAALFKGYGEGDDAEERFINDMKDGKKLASMMLSESFSGIPIAGEVISGTVKRFMGQDVFSSSSNPLTRTFGTGARQMLSTTAKWDERSASENADALLRGLQMLGSVAPQTAFLSQVSNASRDALGFMNNTLSQGFSKADTLDIYEKRIKNVVRSVHAETKDEMKAAKDNKDKRMIRSIDTQRKEEIIGRSREIMLEMGDEMRGEFIKMQKESEKGIEKYIIKQLRVDF